MDANVKKKLPTILTVSFVVVMIVIVGIIMYRGKMFEIWYNAPMVVCGLLILAVPCFWLYVAIKGLDSVLVKDLRVTKE